jgi:hypothetical protein
VVGEVNKQWPPVASEFPDAPGCAGVGDSEVWHPSPDERMCTGARGVAVVSTGYEVTDPTDDIGIAQQFGKDFA